MEPGPGLGRGEGVPVHSPENHGSGEAPPACSSPPTAHVIVAPLHPEEAHSVGVDSDLRAGWLGKSEQGTVVSLFEASSDLWGNTEKVNHS